MKVGCTQEEIINFIYSTAGHYDIRVRHDQVSAETASESVSPVAVAGAATGESAAGESAGTAAGESLAGESAAGETPAAGESLAGETPAAGKPAAGESDGTAAGETPAAGEPAAGESAAREPVTGEPAAREPATGESAAARGRRKKGRAVEALVVRTRGGASEMVLSRLFDEPQAAPTGRVHRLILSGDKRGNTPNAKRVPLFYECNGIVLDADTWRPLAVPPAAFNHHPNRGAVDALLAENLYDAIRVDDGTVITLYRWNHPTGGPRWAMASSNGYDVSGLLWCGPLTYAEVFADLVRRLYPAAATETGMSIVRGAGGTRLDFANLDPRFCYTVGFRHHNFHPLRDDPERIWQIQAADVSNPAFPVSHGAVGIPGIPHQATVDLGAIFGVPTFASIVRAGETAVATAEAFIAKNRVEKRSPAPGGALPIELHYGFILRSRDRARTLQYSDILVGSPLLERVRKVVYERAPAAVRDTLSAEDRLEYNALRAYLTNTDRAAFLALYPDWAAKYQIYEEFTNNVVQIMVHTLRQRAMMPSSSEPNLKSPTGHIARAILAHLSERDSLPPFNKDTASVVRDHVVQPGYAYLFLGVLRKLRG